MLEGDSGAKKNHGRQISSNKFEAIIYTIS